MLSSFSALVDRPFVVGFVIPVMLFFSAISVVLPNYVPLSQAVTALSGGESTAASVVFFVLSLWISAFVLSLANTPIYRFLEGYYWPINEFGWLRRRQERERKSLLDQYKSLRSKIVDSDGASTGAVKRPVDSAEKAAIYDQAQDTLIALKQGYPGDQHPVLPMRIGNVIRAFERYPNDIYGADGVHIWPLVNAVMSDEARKDVANSKADTDFFVNISILASVATLIFFWSSMDAILAVIHSFDGCLEWCTQQWREVIIVTIPTLISMGVAWLSYRAAISKAVSWGVQVRAAFDLNLTKVASQLGLSVPSNPIDTKAMWQAVSMQTVYHEPIPDRYYRPSEPIKKVKMLRSPRLRSVPSTKKSQAAKPKGR